MCPRARAWAKILRTGIASLRPGQRVLVLSRMPPPASWRVWRRPAGSSTSVRATCA
jgi:hypothetical protein